MLSEREQADARIAKELERKLKFETEQERQKQIEYNEQLAKRLQVIIFVVVF